MGPCCSENYFKCSIKINLIYLLTYFLDRFCCSQTLLLCILHFRHIFTMNAAIDHIIMVQFLFTNVKTADLYRASNFLPNYTIHKPHITFQKFSWDNIPGSPHRVLYPQILREGREGREEWSRGRIGGRGKIAPEPSSLTCDLGSATCDSSSATSSQGSGTQLVGRPEGLMFYCRCFFFL